MSTYLVKPTTYTALGGTPWNSYSGTVAGGNLSDGSDATGIRWMGFAGTGLFDLQRSSSPFTIPANEVPIYVSLSTRARRQSGTGNATCRIKIGSAPVGPAVNIPAGGSFSDRSGGTIYRRLTQAEVDGLGVRISATAPAGSPTTTTLDVAELTLLVTTASLPQAPVISAPSGTISDSTRPEVAWTHMDRTQVAVTNKARSGTLVTLTASNSFVAGQTVRVLDVDAALDGTWVVVGSTGTAFTYNTVASGTVGSAAVTGSAWVGDDKPQGMREVAIFTDAQYGIGGFDPASSPATWRVSQSTTSATVTPTADLANDTYRVYVRTAVGLPDDVWGPWAYQGFTIDIDPEPAPDLEVIWDPEDNYVSIAVTGNSDDSGPLSGFELLVERSADGGDSWTQVRTPLDQTAGVVGIVLDDTQALTFSDHEAPRGTAVDYRATIVATVPFVLASEAAEDTVVTTLDGLAWVKSLDHPEHNRGYARLMVSGYDETQDSGTEVFRNASSGRAFVVRHPVEGWDRSVVVECWEAEDVETLKTALGAGTLLLQFSGLYDFDEAQEVRGEVAGQVRVRPTQDARRPRRLTWEVTFSLVETAA